MKDYFVKLPLAGTLTMTIEANTEKEALEKALNVEWGANFTGDVELEELNTYENLMKGNFCFVDLISAEVELVE